MIPLKTLERMAFVLDRHYPDCEAIVKIYTGFMWAIEHRLHELAHAAVFRWKLSNGKKLSGRVAEHFDSLDYRGRLRDSDYSEARAIAVEIRTLQLLNLPFTQKTRHALLDNAFSDLKFYRDITDLAGFATIVRHELKLRRNEVLARRVVRHIRKLLE